MEHSCTKKDPGPVHWLLFVTERLGMMITPTSNIREEMQGCCSWWQPCIPHRMHIVWALGDPLKLFDSEIQVRQKQVLPITQFKLTATKITSLDDFKRG